MYISKSYDSEFESELDPQQIYHTQMCNALITQRSFTKYVLARSLKEEGVGNTLATHSSHRYCDSDSCLPSFPEWPSSNQGRKNRQRWSVLLCWYLHGGWLNKVCTWNHLLLPLCLRRSFNFINKVKTLNLVKRIILRAPLYKMY